jgi:hypothetical protein
MLKWFFWVVGIIYLLVSFVNILYANYPVANFMLVFSIVCIISGVLSDNSKGGS